MSNDRLEWFMVHGSWFVAYDPQFMVDGSWFMVKSRSYVYIQFGLTLNHDP